MQFLMILLQMKFYNERMPIKKSAPYGLEENRENAYCEITPTPFSR